jgi:[acyl-carrier-protein] S-malonyltransferase
VRSTTNDGTAREELAAAIEATTFDSTLPGISKCNATAALQTKSRKPNHTIDCLVKWTQSVQQMIADGALFTEVGPGKVLAD